MPLKWLREQQKLIKDALIACRNTQSVPMTMLNQQNQTSSKAFEEVMMMANNQLRNLDQYGAERVIGELRDRLEDVTARQARFEQVAGDMLVDLKDRLDLLTEAIAVSHMKNDDNKCIKDCLACHIIEVMKGLRAARKLMGES